MIKTTKFTKEILEDLYIKQGLTIYEIAEQENSTPSWIYRLLVKYEIPRRSRAIKGGHHIGQWGKIGHKSIYMGRENKKNKYMAHHRYVMEQYLGKPLTEDQVVHHINGDKADNRIENLQVMSKKEHNLLHNSLHPIQSHQQKESPHHQ